MDEVVSDLESSEAFPTSQTSSVWLDEEDEHRMRQKLTFSKRATHLPAEFRNASEFRDGMSIGERRLADGFCYQGKYTTE
ncbi:unnamed protein product [Protopolystoma xenopodis]|uniref:Uncharacterized protein n=1 Tax=Protopolystoma xenopodis TaxID=117903 RepID=A0A448WZ66_9PLAT|nr:unnamed protein product [Protopolystoma xenopodis]